MNKKEKIKYFDSVAKSRDAWKKRNNYYHSQIKKLLSFLIPPNSSILDLGCGTGDLLNSLKPSLGVGIDFSPEMTKIAKAKYHHLKFLVQDAKKLEINEEFDYIVVSGAIGEFEDIWKVFRGLREITSSKSRVVITYYNKLWEPILKLAELLRLKMPRKAQNWLSLDDINNLLYLNGFEVIKRGERLLLPVGIPWLSNFINRFFATLPVIKHLCLVLYIVARKVPLNKNEYTCSVIVPCRNEAGNIEPAVERIPEMGKHTEIIFVDGYSTDGTVDKIQEMIDKFNGQKDIKLIHQISRDDREQIKNGVGSEQKMLKLGKADAVWKGFDVANGDILMILDADLTVPPEDLPKFYKALSEGRGEFINGTRLVYPLEKGSMSMLNMFANRFFSIIFTWLLGQYIKDTLCGTKVLKKDDYMKIKENRKFLGDFDPFGDFELLFGAAKQNLKIVEIPIRYKPRTYGSIKIERFRHGLLLLKMCLIGFKKFKLSN